MELSRREFLKASGAGMGGLVLLGAMDSGKPPPQTIPLNKQPLGETYTICCYCGVGCGALATATADGKQVLNIEGNPDHPINEGTLCSKGQAMSQFHTVNGENNPNRLTVPLYRAPGSDKWEEKDWDWAINEVAKRIKKTRDETWKETVNVDGTTYRVNRTDAIASFGGGELDNEECYVLVKLLRALGLVYIEHCARI
jgi:formate dehydrogenase major subunit